jgi:glycosyltransferase involved in cell wall biosynthesis
MQSMGIETYQISLHHPFDIKASWKLAKICKKHSIDLIHTQYLRENYIAILSKLFNPRVKVLWTNHYVLWNNGLIRIFNRLFTLFQAGIIAVCTKGKEMLIQNGNSKHKINMIFNGVDTDYWSSASDSTMRREFGIDNNTFVMLCAARFVEVKGYPANEG